MRQNSASVRVAAAVRGLSVRGPFVRAAGRAAVLGVVGAAALPASAHLGSFAPADGYTLSLFSGPVNWCDVSYYNAGAYGPNSGGGPGPTNIVPDSGLWRVVGPVGGFYPTAAARNAAVGGAPPYPTSAPGSLPIYIVGDHGPGRTDASSLAFRNDTPRGTGAAVYDYSIDTYDTGGVAPAAVTGGPVSHQIYLRPNPSDPPNPDGTPAGDKFSLGFMDSVGNIGAQWGYARDNEIYWRPGSAGPWTYTGIYADPGDWDGVRIDIDLTADTFSLDYYDVSSTTWLNLAPAGTPLGAAMGNFTTLRWLLEDGVNSGVGGKNFFDDSSFIIPAPGAAGLLALAGAAAARRRRSS